MPTEIGRTRNCTPPSDQTREIRLARIAVTRLDPGFTQALRQSLICDLLGRLAIEKKLREALNLNHWKEYAKTRIRSLAEELRAERALKIAAFVEANRKRWTDLARRVTRNAPLADQAVAQTAWELWEGRTREEVSSRALVMNARDLLKNSRTDSRRLVSLEGMASEAQACGQSHDSLSPRPDDQDPLDILIARQEERERDDALSYALRNIRLEGNRWILQTRWWKSSGFADLERAMRRSDFGGSVE
jgi:hypothetical protein